MKLLLDANLSPKLATPLSEAGHAVTHVADLGLLTADDTAILQRAETDGYVLVTADTDFPMLVALRRASSPSVVLLRGVAELPMARHAELLVANLPSVAEDLEGGVIVTISPSRVRVRTLPID
jgi:predicted nuclease of predicted toxin-antitoxin system